MSGKINLFLLAIVGITVAILGAGIVFGGQIGATAQVPADNQVSLSADTRNFDWGNISYSGGIVTRSFDIKNNGTSVLKLFNVKTSCMCTTAQLKTGQSLSRKYGMHDLSSDVIQVQPGATAQVIVDFDPAYHGPSGLGPVSRSVTMDTNDPKSPTLSFYLTGTVVMQ